MVTAWVDVMPIARAAPCERSRVIPAVKGPRSLMVTLTPRPVRGLLTNRHVPNGRDLCAAVRPLGLNGAPDAVRWPLSSSPYQVAMTRVSACAAVVSASSDKQAVNIRVIRYSSIIKVLWGRDRMKPTFVRPGLGHVGAGLPFMRPR